MKNWNPFFVVSHSSDMWIARCCGVWIVCGEVTVFLEEYFPCTAKKVWKTWSREHDVSVYHSLLTLWTLRAREREQQALFPVIIGLVVLTAGLAWKLSRCEVPPGPLPPREWPGAAWKLSRCEFPPGPLPLGEWPGAAWKWSRCEFPPGPLPPSEWR